MSIGVIHSKGLCMLSICETRCGGLRGGGLQCLAIIWLVLQMEKLNQGDKQGLEEEMRPQLERLVNVLKDVQGQMKAKDKEMEHLRTQLEEEKRGGQADTQWLLEEKQEELLMLREKAEEMKAQLQAFRAQLDEQETQAQVNTH